MLNSFTANPHGLRIFIEPLLHRFDNMLVLPSRNAALFARGAFGFDCAAAARIGPITPHLLPVFFSGIVVVQLFASRADVDILGGAINKILLAEAAVRFCTRGLRLR